MGVIRDIDELLPMAQKACRLFLAECEKQGLPVLITETYRTQERQDELYAQGRTKPGQIVTWTKNSRHTSRLAWDICKNVKGQEYSDLDFFEKCGEIANRLDIIWGGDWIDRPDRPHFEIFPDWEWKGEEPMTKEERQKFNAMIDVVENLSLSVRKLESPMIYNYVDCNMPEWAKPTITKLLNKGILKGDGEGLNLNDDMLRILVINDRAGIYD
jgi:peptidoglycan L-alanyl-D-glutamate endopeptidase CwlK